jgi:hypothetical protein
MFVFAASLCPLSTAELGEFWKEHPQESTVLWEKIGRSRGLVSLFSARRHDNLEFGWTKSSSGRIFPKRMARAYFMDQLLVLLSEEAATELVFQAGSPPVIVSRAGRRCLQGPPINEEEVAQLLRCLAGSRQMRELQERGAVQFLHTLPDRSAFIVRAAMSGGKMVFGIS